MEYIYVVNDMSSISCREEIFSGFWGLKSEEHVGFQDFPASISVCAINSAIDGMRRAA